ncbi:S8 family serine peptidase [Dactylosporangium sp. NBC_01737]|uniref:S8 family serine peptidase n=1 Tax=Dactylosporangium sp. NBC_01737 TaxID=2975959 RepID=UPI002E14633F|nr:S8 family serine peptidase [Dactylosporangium sp. NBC_01737]
MNIGKRLRAAAAGALLAPTAVTLAAGPAHAVVKTADTMASATSLAQVRSIIGADTGSAATLTGKGVGVALIDTGVASVPGLPATQIVNGPDLSFESQAANLRYQDTYGHGTHMAGIIVGNDTATGTKGIAPGVKLTSVKVGTSTGAVDVSQMIAAIDWVVVHRNDDAANPIKVVNLSYGSGGNPVTWTDPLQFAVEKAWQAGIVVVAAAGNNGNAAGALTNPATDDWVLAVGATATNGTTATTDDTLAAFTNLSSTTTAGAAGQVDLLAPGTSIASLRVPGSNVDNLYPSARVGETLFKGSGTSQATAVVTAAAALLLQAKPTATPNQVKDWLTKGATALTTGTAATLGLRELNVNGALARTGTTVTAPTLKLSSGTGPLQGSRGTSSMTLDGVKLTGERTVWGTFTSSQWASTKSSGTTWSGGLWLGNRVAGDGWTGTSWASRTWAPATWTATPWAGSAAGWSDPAWSGRTWSGRTWSAGTWSGRTWSSDGWSAGTWA